MPIGLSTTAVGGRPFSQCLQIYQELAPKLSLEFLELAIGSRAPIAEIPTDLPIIIHNDWIYSEQQVRLQADLMRDRNWETYKAIVKSHQVLAFSWHFPARSSKFTLEQILHRRVELEQYLERPFSLELMPTAKEFGNLQDWQSGTLKDVPLCVDLSHLNIWAKGNADLALTYTEELRPQAVSWHVSCNNGYQDQHEVIPQYSWVARWLKQQTVKELITYEALPIKYAQYQRTDKTLKNKTYGTIDRR
jgi:hypothetical protein